MFQPEMADDGRDQKGAGKGAAGRRPDRRRSGKAGFGQGRIVSSGRRRSVAVTGSGERRVGCPAVLAKPGIGRPVFQEAAVMPFSPVCRKAVSGRKCGPRFSESHAAGKWPGQWPGRAIAAFCYTFFPQDKGDRWKPCRVSGQNRNGDMVAGTWESGLDCVFHARRRYGVRGCGTGG